MLIIVTFVASFLIIFENILRRGQTGWNKNTLGGTLSKHSHFLRKHCLRPAKEESDFTSTFFLTFLNLTLKILFTL